MLGSGSKMVLLHWLCLVIRHDFYWPDHSKSHANQEARDQMRQMAQASVVQWTSIYNEDHTIFWGFALFPSHHLPIE